MTEGVIAARSHAILPWRFQPLEAKTYTVDVPLSVTLEGEADGEETTHVRFVGTGLDPRLEAGPTQDPDEAAASGTDKERQRCKVPSTPRFTLEGQLGELSTERLTFGDTPTNGIARRIVFVRNLSSTDDLAFRWDCGDFRKVLEVAPVSGRVPPGGATQCRVTFRACDGARVYDFDATCHLRNQT